MKVIYEGFIVDTDSYSGIFEREMCAFMTGHIGDCEIGDKEANEFLESYEALEHVDQVPDEYGCERPVMAYTTPGIWNNGSGFNYRDGEEEQAIKASQEFHQNYYGDLIRRLESERGRNDRGYTEEGIEREIKAHQLKIQESMEQKQPGRYPAYQSVLIHFYKKPSEEVVEFMKVRAKEFAKREGITVTGFRMIGFD